MINCPECKQEMRCVGINGCGNIYVCPQCQTEWVIKKSGEISVKYYKTGAISIDNIRYGPSTAVARFFTDRREKKKTINFKSFEVIGDMMRGRKP